MKKDVALLRAYTRWLFDKPNVTHGHFDKLVDQFLAETTSVTPPADNWNPNTTTPDCDWCGECDWCQNLGRVFPPAEGDRS